MNELPGRPRLRIKNRGGAPKGNRNAFKTGVHTAAFRAWRAEQLAVLYRAKQALRDVRNATAAK